MYSKRWIHYFMDIAERTALQSKDPSTKVGAVLVKDRRVMATGYNGFARGVDDSKERYEDRSTKLMYVVHAEANCIAQCAKYGVACDGLILFVTLVPCTECAKLLINSGIKVIVFKKQDLAVRRVASEYEWRDKISSSVNMLHEAGIELYEYDQDKEVLTEMSTDFTIDLYQPEFSFQE